MWLTTIPPLKFDLGGLENWNGCNLSLFPLSSPIPQSQFFIVHSLLYLAENVRCSTSFANRNMLSFQSTGTGIRVGVVRTGNSTDSRILNRDRLIALFKRIQDSISVETTVSEFPQQSSSKQVNLQQSIPTTRKGRKPKEKSLPKPQQLSKNKLTRLPSNFAKKSPIPSPTPLRSNAHNMLDEAEKLLPDLQLSSNNKLTRLPSNFVKKSPIPSPTPLRSTEHNVVDDTELSSEDRGDPKNLDKMKLSELKGVAKVRGIKGYSKLKKSELLELLRFQI